MLRALLLSQRFHDCFRLLVIPCVSVDEVCTPISHRANVHHVHSCGSGTAKVLVWITVSSYTSRQCLALPVGSLRTYAVVFQRCLPNDQLGSYERHMASLEQRHQEARSRPPDVPARPFALPALLRVVCLRLRHHLGCVRVHSFTQASVLLAMSSSTPFAHLQPSRLHCLLAWSMGSQQLHLRLRSPLVSSAPLSPRPRPNSC